MARAIPVFCRLAPLVRRLKMGSERENGGARILPRQADILPLREGEAFEKSVGPNADRADHRLRVSQSRS